jgi:PAS domain S-box-containing protein
MKIFLSILFLLSSGVFANPQVSFELKKNLQNVDLNEYLELHEDQVGRIDIVEIEKKEFYPITDSNMGFSNSTFWVKLRVKNPLNETLQWQMILKSPIIDYVELYKSKNNKPLFVLGDRVPFSDRPIDYRFPNFTLEETANSETIYYLKIQSESTIPIQLIAFSGIELMNYISNEQIVLGLYFGWMIVMALYNLFLYISTRSMATIFYVLFILTFSLFQFILNGLGFQFLWPNSPTWSNTSLLVFMILSTITGSIFSANFLKAYSTLWLHRLYEIFWFLGLILFISIFIINYSYSIKMATIFAAIAAMLLLFNGFYSLKFGHKEARFFLIAFSVFIFGVIIYSFKSSGFLPSNAFTNWTIQIGSALGVLLLSLGLADKINELSTDLQSRVVELGETNAKLKVSENRFRELFHGVGDIIFVLDSSWNFIDVNKAITRHMGFKSEEIRGKNILEFIYKSKNIQDTYNRIFVMEKLEELLESGSPIEFQAEFRQKYVMEPKEMYVKLQYVKLDHSTEILGTASVMVEDVLNRHIQSERVIFQINNYLRNAEIVSQKLTSHITKFSDSDTLLSVRTSLREIIINAIEHGNLNITFDEKTKAMTEGNYLHFIQQRQEDPRYKDRKIKIEYVLDSKKVAFRITDEGYGFDHKKMMHAKMDQLNEASIQHGRGIMMTKEVFDVIEYNDKGNQVSLVKYFR